MAAMAELWDSRAEYDIGVMIARYLRDNPPPPDSACAADFRDWSDRLKAAGAERLDTWSARPLRAVAGGEG